MAKEFGTVKEGTDMKVERTCWMIEQSSGGGPRNPDPGTTYCFALDFGEPQDHQTPFQLDPEQTPCGNQRESMDKEGKDFRRGRAREVESGG